jgi:hypothetical protein
MNSAAMAQGAAITFGVVGMLTGITSLFLTWQARSEETAVVLAAYPTASPSQLTHEGLAIRFEVVNQSLRPIIVRAASLWQRGEKIGDATGYLDDVRLVERSTIDPSAVTDARRDLPITLPARDGRALVLLIDVWNPVVNASSSVAEVAARRRLNRFLGAVSRLPAEGRGSVQLRVDRVPGGSQWFPLRSLAPPGVYPQAIRDASAVARQAGASFWLIEPAVARGKLTGVVVRRSFAGAGQVDLVHLHLWKQRSLFRRSFTRPVVGQQSTLFPLAALADGQYIVTAELGGRVLATYSFALPWRGATCHGGATSIEPRWCDTAPVTTSLRAARAP